MAMEWQSEDPTTQPELLEVVDPQPGQPHTHTVVFLHGRGDTGSNFARGIKSMTWCNSRRQTAIDVLPTFRWVFPDAGQKPCARPGMPPSMSQWFDVWDHLNFRDHEGLQAPGLRDSVARVRTLIAAEAARLGGRYDKIVLMGISQGGATSVHTLLNLGLPEACRGPKRLGAFVGVACRMPFPGLSLRDTRQILDLEGTPSDELLLNTPVLLEHCMDDPTVMFEGGKQLRQQLEGYGATVAWREYPEGGHWFKSPEGLDDLIQFFTKVLPRD
ncbi:putative phospholipase carboxylesterase family protein [Diaporthe ampelina]|uniref:Putative phospholipase carboxylesterase family protein n=1 Tax=Diaporthe ampelina TaxID=1214573 RepID=A0A0G2HC04_9PEZI|nr:putative phospholipase carboxylesterase family protein [Diaporthe ampelina]